MKISEHANYLLNEYGRLQFDYAAYCKPDGEPLRNEARNNLETYIAELESAQRWIPVSERLPEDLQPTVIITKGGMTGIVRYLELYGREGFGSWSEDVTHWMPLPTPPEEHER